jgi:hypothetical protein
MPVDSRPQTFVARFAAALALTTITMTGAAYFLLQGAPGQPIQVWKNSAGSEVCRITSGGTLTGNCTSGMGGLGTGAVLAVTSPHYVNTSGDTMTGALKVQANMSGSTLNVDSLVSCTNLQTNALGRLACNVSSYLSTTLANDSTFVGNGSAVATATALPSCSDGTNDKLLYNTSTNTFSCGTDQNSAGLTQAAADARYVNTSGDTMTGALKVRANMSGATLNVDGTSTHIGAATFGSTVSAAGATTLSSTLTVTGNVKARANLSGSTLNVDGTAAITGAATFASTTSVAGAATFASTIQATGNAKFKANLSGATLNVNSLLSCTNLQTNSAGLLACNTSSYQTTALAEDNVWVGNGSAVATALTSCSNATTSKLLYNSTTNAFSCGTDTDTDAQLLFQTIAVSGQSNVVADTSTDTLTLAAGSNITITTNAGTDTITLAASGDGAGAAAYGDGSDGNVTLGVNTTLTRDMYYDTLALNGFTLNTASYRVFAKTAISGSGSIKATVGTVGGTGGNGGPGPGGKTRGAAGTAGAVVAAGSLPSPCVGQNGGIGGLVNPSNAPAVGVAGAATTNSVTTTSGSTGATGGAGGTGVFSAGQNASAGGAGGTSTLGASTRNPSMLNLWTTVNGTTWTSISGFGGSGGGGGGGGGGGDSSGDNNGGPGGGGGASGGCAGHWYVSAKTWTGTWTVNAVGGAGGPGGTGGAGGAGAGGGGGGGGAGGGGGIGVAIWTTNSGWSGSFTLTGGAGGAGGTGGANSGGSNQNGANGSTGTTGPAGIAIQIIN